MYCVRVHCVTVQGSHGFVCFSFLDVVMLLAVVLIFQETLGLSLWTMSVRCSKLILYTAFKETVFLTLHLFKKCVHSSLWLCIYFFYIAGTPGGVSQGVL